MTSFIIIYLYICASIACYIEVYKLFDDASTPNRVGLALSCMFILPFLLPGFFIIVLVDWIFNRLKNV